MKLDIVGAQELTDKVHYPVHLPSQPTPYNKGINEAGIRIQSIEGPTIIFSIALQTLLNRETASLWPPDGGGDTDVGISIDNGDIYQVSSLYHRTAVELPDQSPNYSFAMYVVTDFYRVILQSLEVGEHTVAIYTGIEKSYPYEFDVHAYISYTFAVSAPDITSRSPLNITYDKDTIPLFFNVNKEVSWAGYSLDNLANVTAFLHGNTTLTHLAGGNHSLVIYANDTFGSMGKSDTVSFSIVLPTPFPLPLLLLVLVS